MKKFLSVLLMAAGLMSCGDDDKPFIPELNKLTSVTCTKNGNAVHYAYLPQKEITYEYNSQLRPENFPFRVVNSFQPVGFDVISPLNLLYGKMNQNLPTRAYWYNVSDATDICAEYTFRYTLTGDYITGMTIEEKINPVNGATAENNTYEYEFIYNFVVEQK